MKIKTGDTIYENIISVNSSNKVVTGATFDTALYRNGNEYNSVNINKDLTDPQRGVFTFSYSADTTGDYQLYVKNESTGVIFISDVILVRPDDETENQVFVGI